jgi:hypothetical protein
MPEEDFRDPARRRLLDIADNASAEKGEIQTQLPDVSVPSQFDTPIQSTGIRQDVLAGVQGNFDRNIAQIQENALQNRRFRAGSTSNAELNEARSSRNQAIGALGQVELQSQGQVLGALGGLAQVEQSGQEARSTQTDLLTFEQQKVDIMAGGLAIDQGRLTLDRDKLGETARQFDLSSVDQRAQFHATIAATAEQNGLDRAQTAELAAASLMEGARQFDVADATQRQLAGDALAEGARQFGLTQEQTRELADQSLAESARQFDQSDATQRDHFTREIDERARQFGLDQDQTKELAANALSEGGRQFDLSQEQDFALHLSNIAESSRQFELSQEQTLTLAREATTEAARQFDLSSGQDADQFSQNIIETARQFDFSQEQARDLAIESLAANERVANSQLNVQHLGNMISLLTDGTQALTAEDGNKIISAAFAMGDMEASLNISPTADQAVNNVLEISSQSSPEAQITRDLVTRPDIWGLDPHEVSALSDEELTQYENLDFDGDGTVSMSDYIIYSARGG